MSARNENPQEEQRSSSSTAVPGFEHRGSAHVLYSAPAPAPAAAPAPISNWRNMNVKGRYVSVCFHLANQQLLDSNSIIFSRVHVASAGWEHKMLTTRMMMLILLLQGFCITI